MSNGIFIEAQTAVEALTKFPSGIFFYPKSNGFLCFIHTPHFIQFLCNKNKKLKYEDVFVVHCTNLGIVSQGDSTEEAIELYLEEQPEAYEEFT